MISPTSLENFAVINGSFPSGGGTVGSVDGPTAIKTMHVLTTEGQKSLSLPAQVEQRDQWNPPYCEQAEHSFGKFASELSAEELQKCVILVNTIWWQDMQTSEFHEIRLETPVQVLWKARNFKTHEPRTCIIISPGPLRGVLCSAPLTLQEGHIFPPGPRDREDVLNALNIDNARVIAARIADESILGNNWFESVFAKLHTASENHARVAPDVADLA